MFPGEGPAGGGAEEGGVSGDPGGADAADGPHRGEAAERGLGARSGGAGRHRRTARYAVVSIIIDD